MPYKEMFSNSQRQRKLDSRKRTLFGKAQELEFYCDVEVTVIIRSKEDSNDFTYCFANEHMKEKLKSIGVLEKNPLDMSFSTPEAELSKNAPHPKITSVLSLERNNTVVEALSALEEKDAGSCKPLPAPTLIEDAVDATPKRPADIKRKSAPSKLKPWISQDPNFQAKAFQNVSRSASKALLTAPAASNSYKAVKSQNTVSYNIQKFKLSSEKLTSTPKLFKRFSIDQSSADEIFQQSEMVDRQGSSQDRCKSVETRSKPNETNSSMPDKASLIANAICMKLTEKAKCESTCFLNEQREDTSEERLSNGKFKSDEKTLLQFNKSTQSRNSGSQKRPAASVNPSLSQRLAQPKLKRAENTQNEADSRLVTSPQSFGERAKMENSFSVQSAFGTSSNQFLRPGSLDSKSRNRLNVTTQSQDPWQVKKSPNVGLNQDAMSLAGSGSSSTHRPDGTDGFDKAKLLWAKSIFETAFSTKFLAENIEFKQDVIGFQNQRGHIPLLPLMHRHDNFKLLLRYLNNTFQHAEKDEFLYKALNSSKVFVMTRVNSSKTYGPDRTVAQVEHKWWDLKAAAKHAIAKWKNEVNKTGGSSNAQLQPSYLQYQIINLIKRQDDAVRNSARVVRAVVENNGRKVSSVVAKRETIVENIYSELIPDCPSISPNILLASAEEVHRSPSQKRKKDDYNEPDIAQIQLQILLELRNLTTMQSDLLKEMKIRNDIERRKLALKESS